MIVPLSYHDSFIKPVLTKAVSEAASSCCQFVPVKSFLVGNDCIWEHASGHCGDINQVVTWLLLCQICPDSACQASESSLPGPTVTSCTVHNAIGNMQTGRPGSGLMICVTLFCKLCKSKNTQTCENSTRFACYSLMSVCFWTVQHAKQCNKIWYLGPLPKADWLLLQQTASALSFHTGGSC